MTRWSTLSLLLLLGGCASTPPGARAHEGLPNFCEVDAQSHFYRGAAPSLAGYSRLSEMGIKTVIDLRKAGAGKAEERYFQDRYLSKPLPGLHAPKKETVQEILSAIDKPENQPVFIHCRRGADRTGTVVALYRITHDCWTAERAIQEARDHGMSWLELGMRRFIRSWYQEVKSQCPPAG